MPRFLFVPPRWEVVQLVGLQTLTLAILVRVQASQPIFTLRFFTYQRVRSCLHSRILVSLVTKSVPSAKAVAPIKRSQGSLG